MRLPKLSVALDIIIAQKLTAQYQPELGIGAVVSRGGGPDLAMDYLHLVRSPSLLIVGGKDSHPP